MPCSTIASSCAHAGIFNCGTTIIREEGAKSLWKGLTPFAGNLTLKYFLRFGTNGLYQNLLRDSVSIGQRRSTKEPELAAHCLACRCASTHGFYPLIA
jgi:hypothetical protein